MAVKLRERKPGEWWIFVDHKGRRFAKKVGTDKRVAKSIAREVEKRLASGDLGIGPKDEPRTPTVESYAEKYLDAIEHTLAHKTCVDYESNLRLRILPELGTMQLGKVTRQDVKAMATKLRQEGASARTVKKTIATLSSLFTEAVDDEVIETNPCVGLKLKKDPKRAVKPLTREELAHLLTTAETHAIERAGETVHPYRAHHPFLLLLARTGVRLGEAIGLRWGDVDLHGGFLEVRRAIVCGRETLPKSKKTRRVYLSAQLQETLRRLREERFEKVIALHPEREAERRADTDMAEAWLFPGPSGKPMDPDNFRARVFEPLLAAAEMRHVRIHDLRHTYASLMIAAGKELHFIQQQLGHHSPKFTLEVYGHLLPRDRRDDVNCLDDDATDRNPSATGPSETAAA